MDLGLNNRQNLICHKTQTNKSTIFYNDTIGLQCYKAHCSIKKKVIKNRLYLSDVVF